MMNIDRRSAENNCKYEEWKGIPPNYGSFNSDSN